VLQTTALIDQVERERSQFARQLQHVQDKRRDDLLGKLQEANVRLATIRAKLQAVGDKLLYSGVVRSQLVRGSGGEPDVKLYRNVNDTSSNMPANQDTGLMPGDVVEVRLRAEDLPKLTQSGSPAAHDEGQQEAVGARK
jgi:polysaccharide export outer membrane protein